MPNIESIPVSIPPEVNKEVIEYLRMLLKRLHTENCDWLEIKGVLVNSKGKTDWVEIVFPDTW